MAKRIDVSNLVGAFEIAESYGLAFPNVVHSWRKRHTDFPQPVAQLKAGLIWDMSEVDDWMRHRRMAVRLERKHQPRE
jgi:predicted DNA-binding transcriptional regulator AlpA